MLLKFTLDNTISCINSNSIRRFDYFAPPRGTSGIVFIIEYTTGEKITYYGANATKLYKLFMDVFEVVNLDDRTIDQSEPTEDSE